MCQLESWSTRALARKVDGMLYERTVAALIVWIGEGLPGVHCIPAAIGSLLHCILLVCILLVRILLVCGKTAVV
jgi:hypothetical protein